MRKILHILLRRYSLWVVKSITTMCQKLSKSVRLSPVYRNGTEPASQLRFDSGLLSRRAAKAIGSEPIDAEIRRRLFH
jgi:hypothetical protein